jgi:hypothetical protein
VNGTHPEPAEIAALDEDLLPSAEAAVLRNHLNQCDTCTEIRADLGALTDALGDLPDPGPLPDDIAARIDTALAGEAARAVSRETRKTADAPRRLRQQAWYGRAQVALAACGAVVALVAGGAVLQAVSDDAHSDDGASDMAGELEAAYGEEADEGAAQTGEPLEFQVRALLAEAESTHPLTAEGDAAPEEATPDADVPPEQSDSATEVPACVENAIGRREAPLAADEEDYAGIDAYLVVFPHEADPDRVDAYVVAASCATASPADSGSGEILVQESYPRD